MLLGVLTVGAAHGEPCALGGRAVDRHGSAVSGAVVTLVASGESSTTDAAGRFSFTGVRPGRTELVVVADGYAVAGDTLRCDAGEELVLEVSLSPAFGEELVVTATRTEKRLADLPVHTQVIARAEIESSAARTLADAVEFTSGVRVESNCQNCNFSQIRMLGLEGPYSQILVDGQPTVSSLALVYGVEQFPARLIDSVEVVKGGGSATYGGGAVGGVINLIPHQPSHTSAVFEARYLATGGEPGRSLSGLADWAAADRGRSLSVFAQSDEIDPVDVDGDRYSEVTRRELTTFGVRFDQYALASKGRFSVETNRTEARRRGGDLERFALPPDRTALTEAIDTRRTGLSLGWLHQASPRFDYRATSSLAVTKRDSYYGAGFDPDAYGVTENPLWIADLQLNHGFARSTLTWGVQNSRDEIEDLQLGYGRQIAATYRDLGVYLQDDRKLAPSVSLLYGARADRHSEIGGEILSPRLALLWSPRADLTFRSSVAAGFRPPVVFDEDLHIVLVGGGDARVVRNDPGLVEERSTAFLLSTEWRPVFGRFGAAAVELNLFRTDLDDLFHNVEADDPATPEVELLRRNSGGARVEGAELSISVRWGSKAGLDLGFVRQSSRFDVPEPDFGSRDFFRTPDRYGTASLSARLPHRLELFAGAIYTGPMTVPHYAGFIDADRLERTPSFLSLDLNLSRRLPLGGHREVKLTAGVKNLTDEYQGDLDRGPDRDSAYVYGPRFPRSVFVGVQIEL
ncbi:MAG: TonB-dependent receptor [Thermoanaerobaculia bacterium]|nr:TonB-dependent receptor [Thermoanaerobaculia bacterium]